MQNHCAQRSYVDSSLQGDQWVATLYHVLISSLQPSKKYHPQPREPCPHHTHTSPSLTQSTSHIAPSPHRQSDPRQQPFAMHASSPCPNRAYSSAYILVPLFLAISIGGKVPWDQRCLGYPPEWYPHQLLPWINLDLVSRASMWTRAWLVYHRALADARSKA